MASLTTQHFKSDFFGYCIQFADSMITFAAVTISELEPEN